MPTIELNLDGGGAWKDLEGKDIVVVPNDKPLRIAVLPKGMQSGLPSVGFTFELKDGTQVFAETSVRAFLSAARAIDVRYGWAVDRT